MNVHVVAARPDVCLISDRHAGLLQSILKLQRGTATMPPLWPDVQNRWCIRHMGANFYDHFKNGFFHATACVMCVSLLLYYNVKFDGSHYVMHFLVLISYHYIN